MDLAVPSLWVFAATSNLRIVGKSGTRWTMRPSTVNGRRHLWGSYGCDYAATRRSICFFVQLLDLVLSIPPATLPRHTFLIAPFHKRSAFLFSHG